MEPSPAWTDVVFPILAFLLTILGPALVAVWVIYRAVTDKKLYDPEQPPTLDRPAPDGPAGSGA